MVPASQLNLQMTAYQRMLKFGSAQVNEEHVGKSGSRYIHQVFTSIAFDDSVIINRIDSETVDLLTYYSTPRRRHESITGRSRSFRLWKSYTRSNKSIDISTDHECRFKRIIWIKFVVTRSMSGIARMPMLDRSHTYKRARC